jgi:hypothetical protein
MKLTKAMWHTDGDTVRVTMPLQKVDQENRIVSGFATLDNIDTSDDVVLASASAGAFANFRGNIRLMHQPIPAGKLVNFREESYYDTKTQKFYNGIYVDVYISKGAPDIWEMCLDGTLTGFSIGGQVTDQETQFVKDAGKAVRFIKAYTLIELSLVDSPANQLCDIFSITKSADGSTTVTGMISEVVAENVFYCPTDEIAFVTPQESKDCSACGSAAKNIGWFESDGGDKTEKVNAIVAGYVTETDEGRVNKMADETVNEVVETEEVEAAAEEVVETPAATEEVEAEVEETEEVAAEPEAEVVETEEAAEEEVAEVEKAVETPDFAKMFADLSATITQAAEASANELAEVNKKLSAVDEVAQKLDELGAKHAELAEKFSAVNEQLEGVEKRFEAVEKSTGIKKSADLGGSTGDKVEKSTKSLWNGRFLGSIDNV